MAQPYVTGPAHIFIGVGPRGAPLYLGTSEGEPEIALLPEYDQIMNDISGSRKPMDRQFMGEEAMISAVLTRYNEIVLAAAQARVRGTIRGAEPFGSIGALMGGEGNAFPLWLVFPYVVKPAMAAGGMPAGYRFVQCFDESDRMPVGTRARRVHVQFHAQRFLTIAGGGTGLLYDHNVAGLPNPN